MTNSYSSAIDVHVGDDHDQFEPEQTTAGADIILHIVDDEWIGLLWWHSEDGFHTPLFST